MRSGERVRGSRLGRERRQARGQLVRRDVDGFLRALAAARFLSAAQLGAMFGLSELVVRRRLRVLRAHGLAEHFRPFQAEPGIYAITSSGLGLLGSDLPTPRLNLRTYRHDLLVGWAGIELSAEFPDHVLVTERQMRSRDRRSERPGERRRYLGVADGVGPSGYPRIHYPDVAFCDSAGDRRIAVEVELSAKGRRRLERIMETYAWDRQIERMIYLTDSEAIAEMVRCAATRAGARQLLEVRPLERGERRK